VYSKEINFHTNKVTLGALDPESNVTIVLELHAQRRRISTMRAMKERESHSCWQRVPRKRCTKRTNPEARMPFSFASVSHPDRMPPHIQARVKSDVAVLDTHQERDDFFAA
jgi:hypothetical protein